MAGDLGARGGARALLLAFLAVGCGAAEDPPPATSPGSTPAPTAAPAPETSAASAPDVERGASLYALYCATCHGARGDGDGPAAQGLDPRPARHGDGSYMNGLSDDYLFEVIAKGGAAVGKSPLMAPWGGTLDDAQIRDVIAFIRTLADPT